MFPRVKHPLISITILLLGIFAASCIWIGLAFPPAFIYPAGGMAGLCLPPLFFAHLWFAIFRPSQRTANLTATILIVVFIIAFLFGLPRLVASPERRWFIQIGREAYGLMVEKIIENEAMLTSKWQPLTHIVASGEVHGKTNTDGSLAISFPLHSNYSRGHGYFYYSGSEMVLKPGKQNKYFLPDTGLYYEHLTNNWYNF
jgi:hypothetical protein